MTLCLVGDRSISSNPASLASPASLRGRYRGQGIGQELVGVLIEVARSLGYVRLFAATETAPRLVQPPDWTFLERVDVRGDPVSVFEMALERPPQPVF
jgi:GNAT superfamily N-acetyltransferase